MLLTVRAAIPMGNMNIFENAIASEKYYDKNDNYQEYENYETYSANYYQQPNYYKSQDRQDEDKTELLFEWLSW